MGPPRCSSIFALMAIAALVSLPAAGEPTRLDPDTGAATWEVQVHGVTLSLTQLLPDQVRAFYVNRGFALSDTAVFAEACVFMTVLRNDGAPGELSFRLADWQLRQGGTARGLPPLDDWMAQWEARGVGAAARIAFRWAQFPPGTALCAWGVEPRDVGHGTRSRQPLRPNRPLERGGPIL